MEGVSHKPMAWKWRPWDKISSRDKNVELSQFQQLKSSFPKPDKSTFDENSVFNIIVQNYMRASNRVKFRSR